MPPALEVLEPPVPFNFSVTTDDHITFALDWEVDDPAIVSYYRIYATSALTSPVVLDSTVSTSATVVTEDGLPIRGITFCVTSVTPESVESRLVCQATD